MVFVCVSIRTDSKIVKNWYARSVLDGKKTLSDVFAEFATGEFDDGRPIGDEYQTTKIMVFCRSRGLGYVPVGLFLLLIFTVGISYLIAVLKGDVAVVFPYISDTGGKPPESCVFAEFVNLSALVLLALMYIRYKEVDTTERLPPQSVTCLNKASFILGIVGTLGLTFVGNFQDTNVLVVHEIGAATLFLCATIYTILQTRITYLLYPEYRSLFVFIIRLLLSVIMVVSLVTCFACEAVATVEWNSHHNATDKKTFWKPTDGGYTVHIISAAFEWALAFTFTTFCLTFYSELSKVSLKINMFLHVDPFPVSGDDSEPNEYTKLYA